jgi:nitric oxide reductase NorQ protein
MTPTTTNFITDVDTQLQGSFPQHARIAELDEMLPALIGAFFAQDSNEALAGILDKYTNKASRIRGRSAGNSATTAKAPKVVDPNVLTEGLEFYTRPNGDKYYTRKWGIHDDVLVMRKAREIEQFTLLYGAPGCGKTALIEAAFGDDLFTVLGSGDTEVSDLVGAYTQSPDGGFLWTDGPLIQAAEAGKPLLIDEIGLIEPKVLSVVYGLMDGRRSYNVTANPERGIVKAKAGFYVVGATNPNAPGVRLSEALLSRFTIQAEVTTDYALARKLGAPSLMVTAAQSLSKKQYAGEVSWAPQFRELFAFRDNEVPLGTKWALQNMVAAAPAFDRPVVQDVIARAYGENILPARI